MTTFHAVMIDECGSEFGANVTARSRAAAWEKIRDMYPECRCVQVESPADRNRRERALQRAIQSDLDYEYGW